MKKIIYILTIAILSSCSSTAQKLKTTPSINSDVKKPNVIFILADDLGINALNCYGNDLVESPNIDKLYNEGMHFTNGYSNDPTCAPSRAAILSGQYAPRTQVYRVADRWKSPKLLPYMKFLPPVKRGDLDPKILNIPTAFKKAGYNTAGYGKWHLGNENKSPMASFFDHGIEAKPHYGFKTTPHQTDVLENEYNADYCTRKGISFMEKSVKEDKPFFLYMPYFLVHKPLDPKEVYRKHFQEKLADSKYNHPEMIDVLSMIKSLDDSVGELIAALKKMGIEENTIIVFTSDNGHYKVKGKNMFALPYKGNKGQTYEGGIRVPYIYKWKNKIQANSVSNEANIHVDIFPTLLDLAGIEKDKTHIFDGVSLAPILLGKEAAVKDRDALIWMYTNYSVRNKQTGEWITPWLNVIQMGDYKLTENIETRTYTLYDLAKDPFEEKEISKSNPKMVKKLVARLEQWKKETNYPEPEKNPDYNPNKK